MAQRLLKRLFFVAVISTGALVQTGWADCNDLFSTAFNPEPPPLNAHRIPPPAQVTGTNANPQGRWNQRQQRSLAKPEPSSQNRPVDSVELSPEAQRRLHLERLFENESIKQEIFEALNELYPRWFIEGLRPDNFPHPSNIDRARLAAIQKIETEPHRPDRRDQQVNEDFMASLNAAVDVLLKYEIITPTDMRKPPDQGR